MNKMGFILDITLDATICSVLDCFKILLQRMILCRRAAELLDCKMKRTAYEIKIIQPYPLARVWLVLRY